MNIAQLFVALMAVVFCSNIGGSAGSQGFEGELQRVRHDTTEGAYPQSDRAYTKRSGFVGFFQRQGERVRHNG
jgi:hypothetical protein